MSESYITKIEINKIRHLEGIVIELSEEEKKHLILTGKNGSGKTSVLNAIKAYLKCIEDKEYLNLMNCDKDIERTVNSLENPTYTNLLSEIEKDRYIQSLKQSLNYYENLKLKYKQGINISLKGENILEKYKEGKFILAYFDAHRKVSVDIPDGVEKINLQNVYSMDSKPSSVFIKYLVDLKTQQSFAQNEGDTKVVEKIGAWFEKFENNLRMLMDDDNLKLKFDYRNYNFEIIENGKEPYGFDKLSDGYSSVLNIIMDLMLRMEKNIRGIYDLEGIVLIDEIETHLHLALQKKIMKFLTEFFPRIQFIISTHSPFILNSLDNAVIYDLEKNIKMEDLSLYSYEGIVEGYFDVDNYSDELKAKIKEYRELAFRKDLNDDEKARRAELRIEFKNVSKDLAKELKDEFNAIEEKRKKINDSCK